MSKKDSLKLFLCPPALLHLILGNSEIPFVGFSRNDITLYTEKKEKVSTFVITTIY